MKALLNRLWPYGQYYEVGFCGDDSLSISFPPTQKVTKESISAISDHFNTKEVKHYSCEYGDFISVSHIKQNMIDSPIYP